MASRDAHLDSLNFAAGWSKRTQLNADNAHAGLFRKRRVSLLPLRQITREGETRRRVSADFRFHRAICTLCQQRGEAH